MPQDLDALLASDLGDLGNRLALGDALELAGRLVEAALCRDMTARPRVFVGRVYRSERPGPYIPPAGRG